MISRRSVIGGLHRVAYATLLGVAGWYLTVVPFGMTPLPRTVHVAALRVLDFPIAIVNSVLPWQLRGIDVFATERQPERANMWQLLHAHLRVSVPTYVLLFYVPMAAWTVRKALRERHARKNIRGRPGRIEGGS
jgi:hypothetical protein